MSEPTGVPGAEGALLPGRSVPSQEAPLSLQPVGAPGPAPLKPKVTEAPGARVPFQPLSLAVQWLPVLVTVASQAEPTLVPAGKSHSIVQDVSVVVPVFFTVHLPSNPEPQSEPLAKVAVAPAAAWAGVDRPTTATRGRVSAVRPAAAALNLFVGRAKRVSKRGLLDVGADRGGESVTAHCATSAAGCFGETRKVQTNQSRGSDHFSFTSPLPK